MPAVVVVGSQWGDEGKGKVVDLLTEQADIVARFQGGNNAGHTVMFGDKTYVLHLIPSGIFREGRLAVLGNGVVVDPRALLDEIAALRTAGVEVGENLRVSDQANLVMPYHKDFDKLREQIKGAGKIGTTGRGIGPAYEDKMAREGLRFSDFHPNDERVFRDRISSILEEKNFLLRNHFRSDEPLYDAHRIYDEYAAMWLELKPLLCDTSTLLNQALDEGKRVLFEGAQGTLLDVDHGTYPYVTSSNTMAGGACTGTGVGPTRIDKVIGITKAYTTRVGEGPFPTELAEGPVGALLQKRGQEFGATTGRVRRCGWFDAVAVRTAVQINGMGGLAMMKLDVMDPLETLKICVAYEDNRGKTYEHMPHFIGLAEQLTPIYEEMPGWNETIRGITEYDQLPRATRNYLDRIAELVGAPVVLVSTGPKREETIQLGPLFA